MGILVICLVMMDFKICLILGFICLCNSQVYEEDLEFTTYVEENFEPLKTLAESQRELKRLQSHHSFKSFVVTHKKNYANFEEYQKRFGIFKENMKKTQFSDLTEEEFKERHLGFYPPKCDPVMNIFESDLEEAEIPEDVELPDAFDWRTHGAVTPVKNQGMCGSCWAFSVTGNVEGQWKIQHGELLSLSEQELVDCDTLDAGCNGGLPENAYKAIAKIGVWKL